ncbi:thermonuclease family protein [Flavobacterium sp. LB3R33]|uniref:thermonuclease family protein n=1 Tax=Flavobacterium sp. LB3R33 TaxID=3401721 RepID=UPI003AB04CA4
MIRYVYFLFLISFTGYGQVNYTGKIVGVTDGDTVVVLDSLNHQTILPLLEVDCPEKSQAFGTKAKQFTSDQIYRKKIKICCC